MRQHDLDPLAFGRRLADAQAWCLPRVRLTDPEHSLRTPALRPPQWRVGPRWPAGFADHDAPTDRNALVEATAIQRRELLAASPRLSPVPVRGLAGGRLLVFNPDMSLSDGAAETASRGFFDTDNTPPWDTWLCFVDETAGAPVRVGPNFAVWRAFLISWVPEPLLDDIAEAVLVNPEQCVIWADDLDSAFIQGLGQGGADAGRGEL